MDANPTIVQPPQQIFKAENIRERLVPAQRVVRDFTMYEFEKAEFPESGGIYAWFKGCPFPAKGFPTPQAVHAANEVKRWVKSLTEAIATKDLLFTGIGFFLTPKKKKINILSRFCKAFADSAEMTMSPHLLEDTRYGKCPREIMKFLENLLNELGISDAKRTAELFGVLIEYDDAYRYRIEDIMSEVTKQDLLDNPIKGILKMVNVLKEREPKAQWENVKKFERFATILRFLFWSRFFKKAFITALKKSEFENFQYDDADRFHVMLRADYHHLGYKVEERIEMYKAWFQTLGFPLPPRITIKV